MGNMGSMESPFQDGPALLNLTEGGLASLSDGRESTRPVDSLRNVVDC